MLRSFRVLVMLTVVLAMVLSGGVLFAGGEGEGAAEGEPQTLEIWSTLTQEERAEELEKMADDFAAEHPGVSDVEITTMSWSGALDRYISAVMADEAPDMATLGQGWPQTVQGTGGLVPVDDVVERIGGEDIFLGTSLLPQGGVEGTAYSVPLYVTPYAGVYRESWLEEAGMDPPQTWEEFYDVSVAVTDEDEDRYGFALPLGDENVGKSIWAFLLSNDVTIFTPTGDGEFELNINQPNAVEAYEFMYRLARDAGPDGMVSYNNTDLDEMVADGVLWSRFDSAGTVLSNVKESNPDILDDFDMVPFPEGARRGSAQGWVGLSVFEGDNVDLSKDFIEFMYADEERLIDYYLTFPYSHFPAVESHWSHPSYVEGIETDYSELTPLLDIGVEILENSAPIGMWEGENPWAGELDSNPILGEALVLMLTEDYSAEEAVDWLEDQLNDMMR